MLTVSGSFYHELLGEKKFLWTAIPVLVMCLSSQQNAFKLRASKVIGHRGNDVANDGVRVGLGTESHSRGNFRRGSRMHRFRSWSRVVGLGALILVLTTTLDAQESKKKETEKPKSTWSWFPRWWSRSSDKPKPEAKEKPKQEEPKKEAPETARVLRERAYRAYLRREQVCDKIRVLALKLNDVRLQKRADGLEKRAWQIYVRSTSQLSLEKKARSLSAVPNSEADALLKKYRREQSGSDR